MFNNRRAQCKGYGQIFVSNEPMCGETATAETERRHVESVNIRLSKRLADRTNAAAAAIGLTRAELMRRAVEAECTSTEELAAWREHEFDRPAIEVDVRDRGA